jgi:DNA polymerase-1
MAIHTWALLDVSNLTWAAFHGVYGKGPTPDNPEPNVARLTMKVMLESARSAMRSVGADRAVFCFDSSTSKREAEMPGYKSTRKAKAVELRKTDPKKSEAMFATLQSLHEMRTSLSVNKCAVLQAEGYEADDMLALCASRIASVPEARAVIVSSDQDLYQCLSDRCDMWKPGRAGRFYTEALFRSEFGLSPEQWPTVKAIAGCKTDDIPKVRGVGEATAAKFLAGTLPEKHKTYAAIVAERSAWESRLAYTKLPWPGLPRSVVQPMTLAAFAERKLARVCEDWKFLWTP